MNFRYSTSLQGPGLDLEYPITFKFWQYIFIGNYECFCLEHVEETFVAKTTKLASVSRVVVVEDVSSEDTKMTKSSLKRDVYKAGLKWKYSLIHSINDCDIGHTAHKSEIKDKSLERVNIHCSAKGEAWHRHQRKRREKISYEFLRRIKDTHNILWT